MDDAMTEYVGGSTFNTRAADRHTSTVYGIYATALLLSLSLDASHLLRLANALFQYIWVGWMGWMSSWLRLRLRLSVSASPPFPSLLLAIITIRREEKHGLP